MADTVIASPPKTSSLPDHDQKPAQKTSANVFRLPRSLNRKVQLAFLLIALLAAANLYVANKLHSASDDFSATINLAGKMRMLSQRITLAVLSEHGQASDDGEKISWLMRDFRLAYETLHQGGSLFGLHVPPLAPRLQPYLADVLQAWHQYQATLDQLPWLAGSRSAELVPETFPASGISDIIAAGEQVLAMAEILLDELVLHSERVQMQAYRGFFGLFAIDLVFLLLAYLFFHRRILRPIRSLDRQAREFAAGNYAARSQLATSDELGVLGSTLNRSAERIARLLRKIEQERASLREIKMMFDGLASNTVAGIYLVNKSCRIIYANEQLSQIVGYPQAELADNFELARLFDPHEFQRVKQALDNRLGQCLPSTRFEAELRHADGRLMHVEIFGSAMSLHGQPTLISIMLDITKRKQAEASSQLAALVYEHTSEAMVVTDKDGYILDINPAFTSITGYTMAEAIGKRMSLLSSGRHDSDFYRAMWKSLQETGRWSGDIHNRRKSGEEFIEHLKINTSFNDDGSVNCRIGLFSDVTKLRQRSEQIWRQAHFDHLTQLPNRKLFHENLNESIRSHRDSGHMFALVFIDLDMFKEVNDTYGHDQGDRLLRQAAKRLRNAVREQDHLARLGGDEFTLISTRLKDPSNVDGICSKLLKALVQPYKIGDDRVLLSASIGVSIYPRDGKDGPELLRSADTAMYVAKAKGRNRCHIYRPEDSIIAEIRS